MKQLVLPADCRADDRVSLTGREFHYLIRVRRMSIGTQITALEGAEQLTLELRQIDESTAHFQVIHHQAPAEVKQSLTLFPFLLKARKLDDVIRQACEAGVQTLVPVEGEHCVSRIDRASEAEERKKLERWRAIAREAAQQSGNASVCQICPAVQAQAIPEWWHRRGPLLFFHQEPLAKGGLGRYLTSQPSEIGLIVGPEGGLSRAEVACFQSQGGVPIWLGPRVLRAETASLYAIAAVQTILQEQTEWTIPS